MRTITQIGKEVKIKRVNRIDPLFDEVDFLVQGLIQEPMIDVFDKSVIHVKGDTGHCITPVFMARNKCSLPAGSWQLEKYTKKEIQLKPAGDCFTPEYDFVFPDQGFTKRIAISPEMWPGVNYSHIIRLFDENIVVYNHVKYFFKHGDWTVKYYGDNKPIVFTQPGKVAMVWPLTLKAPTNFA